MISVVAIIPENSLDPAALVSAIMQGLDSAALDVKAEFEKTVASWGEKPEFQIQVYSPYQRDIFTENQVYGWVTHGTPPHEILPIRAQALRFMMGGSPKTMPGILSSGSGTKGTTPVFAKRVDNPGITARDFDVVIAEEWADGRLAERIQASIDKAVT